MDSQAAFLRREDDLLVCLFWSCLFLQDSDALFQIQFDIKLVEGERRVSAQLVLSKVADDRFSIHCRKAPSGTLFTFWAQPEASTLAIPKEKAAFVGKPDERVVLFPDGPALTRAEWLALLEFGTWPEQVSPSWRFHQEGEDFVLDHRQRDWRIEWSVRKRHYKNRFSKRILEPSLGDRYEVQPLAEVVHFWNQ